MKCVTKVLKNDSFSFWIIAEVKQKELAFIWWGTRYSWITSFYKGIYVLVSVLPWPQKILVSRSIIFKKSWSSSEVSQVTNVHFITLPMA